MFRILATIAILTFTLSSANAGTYVCTNGSFANLRNGPGTEYPIIMPVYNMTPVTVLHRHGEWSRLRLEPGLMTDRDDVGYIRSDFLKNLREGYHCFGKKKDNED